MLIIATTTEIRDFKNFKDFPMVINGRSIFGMMLNFQNLDLLRFGFYGEKLV